MVHTILLSWSALGALLDMEIQNIVEVTTIDSLDAVAITSARERDLDNFLLEEIHASKKFRTWLLSRLQDKFAAPSYHNIVVGKNPKREVAIGQTDLSAAFLDKEGRQVSLLLIESKVASGFQPEQPERYKFEVEAARQRLGQRHAAAVVIAPKANWQVLDHVDFDATILLEEIVEHLRSRVESERDGQSETVLELRARLEKKIELLEYLAGKRARSSWSASPVPERLDFMELYRKLALEIAPGLVATASSGGKKSASVLFTGLQVPGLDCKNIRHDFGSSHRVSLVIGGAAAVKARIQASGLLPTGASVDTTGAGALLIRLPTPRLSPTADLFATQRPVIQGCIERVLELQAWAHKHAEQVGNLMRRTVGGRG